MSVPNQRIIYIHKNSLQKEPFLTLSKSTIQAVYKDLQNAYTFFLYLCFCCNKDGFKFEFSPKAIEQEFGIKQSTARDQFKILIEKGYLVRQNEKSNIYNFYAEPQHIKNTKSLEVFNFEE